MLKRIFVAAAACVVLTAANGLMASSVTDHHVNNAQNTAASLMQRAENAKSSAYMNRNNPGLDDPYAEDSSAENSATASSASSASSSSSSSSDSASNMELDVNADTSLGTSLEYIPSTNTSSETAQ